jgi:hypothetical protein
MWGLLFSPGSFWRVAGAGSGNDPLAPAAPVATWDTAASDNTPTLSGVFDDTPGKFWEAGDIDASNYDRLQAQVSKFSDFSVIEDDGFDDLDADDITNGFTDPIGLGPLADGLTYGRIRHNHVVAGVDHYSPWSNTVSETIVTATSAGESIGLLVALTKAA